MAPHGSAPAGAPPPEGDTVSLEQLLAETRGRLAGMAVENAAAEAAWILAEVTGLPVAELALAQDKPATVRQVARLDSLVARRLAGEPLQYVLGSWGFRGLDLAVDARALIPRPETEAVVEVALGELDRLVDEGRREPLAVDLGTGTGAIGLSLAAERPRVRVIATDVSADALALARANLAGLGQGAQRVRLVHGRWWQALDPSLAGSIDLVVSNPPYVPDGAPLPEQVAAWEPEGALRAGPDGLADLRVIVSGAHRWLAPRGALVVEMGEEQGAALMAMADEAGLVDAAVRPDLAGRPRAMVARQP
ncbi:MAG: peptide chain release factor N(5)-glutamine methyltransferase [Microthrixaceae bacterium]